MRRTLLALSMLFSVSAWSQGTEGPAGEAQPEATADTPEAKAAKELVTKYLTAIKAKKWADAKKLIHPQTLTVIADHKKRLGKEDHAMAP